MICKSCGANLSENTKYCGKCGAKNEEDITLDSHKTTVSCPSCGARIAEGADFCEKCGTNRNTTFKCEVCGSVVSASAEFCSGCGTEFKTEKSEQKAKKEKGRRRSICFCTFSAIFLVGTFFVSHFEGELAFDLKLQVIVFSSITLILGVVAWIEAYRTNNKISIVNYVCIIMSLLFLIAWSIKGDEVEAERLAEYYSSDDYEAKQMRDALDKLFED